MELKDQLLELQGQLKTHFEKAAEQEKALGTVSEELKTKIDAVQKQVDAIDVKLAGRLTAAEEAEDGFEEQMKNDASIQRLLKDKRGNAVVNFTGKSARELFERKTGKRISAASKQTINTARTHMKSADDLLIALTNDEADDDGEDSDDDTSGEKAVVIAASEPVIDHSAAQTLIESMKALIPAA